MMRKTTFLTQDEMNNLLNDPDFANEIPDDNNIPIDVVAVHPHNVCVVSDEDDSDQNELSDSLPNYVPGS